MTAEISGCFFVKVRSFCNFITSGLFQFSNGHAVLALAEKSKTEIFY